MKIEVDQGKAWVQLTAVFVAGVALMAIGAATGAIVLVATAFWVMILTLGLVAGIHIGQRGKP